jgi:hypothetical protein
MSVKKGLKFGLGATAAGSEVWRGSVDIDVVLMVGLFERRTGRMDREFERGRPGEARFGGGMDKGEVEAGGGAAGLDVKGDVEELGGSLPGRGGVGIEASTDMM